MKNQYFGDKRDFFKWDFLEDLLEAIPELKTFTNITMLTAPDETNQGRFRDYPQGRRREGLYNFLQNCRVAGQQRVSEMQGYFRGRIAYFPYGDTVQTHYTYESRHEYFDNIPDQKLQHALVFFDPDIGLNVDNESYMARVGISKYLFIESLSAVATRASEDSVIVVYQHLQRDRNKFWDDIEDRCGRFLKAVDARGAAFITDRDIAFLTTSRDATVRLIMSKAIVAHAHKHGLDCGDLAT